MAANRESSDLDRLIERWGTRAPSPAPPDGDEALVDALVLAIERAFPPGGKELALALALIEDGSPMRTGSQPRTPTRVRELVRAMHPADGAPSPAATKALRADLAAALDRLEDLLDGLSVAVRPPGGAARG